MTGQPALDLAIIDNGNFNAEAGAVRLSFHSTIGVIIAAMRFSMEAAR